MNLHVFLFVSCFIIDVDLTHFHNKSKGHENEKISLECNFCLHSRKKKDIMDGLNQNSDCMNKAKFQSREDMRRTCTSSEQFCVSTVTNLNGFFILIDRDCASDCSEGCVEKGYGLFYTECTRCCKTSLCNDWNGRKYYMPNSVHNTFGIITILLYSSFNNI